MPPTKNLFTFFLRLHVIFPILTAVRLCMVLEADYVDDLANNVATPDLLRDHKQTGVSIDKSTTK